MAENGEKHHNELVFNAFLNMFSKQCYRTYYTNTPLKFNSSPLKNDGWKTIQLPFGKASLFRAELLNFGRAYGSASLKSVDAEILSRARCELVHLRFLMVFLFQVFDEVTRSAKLKATTNGHYCSDETYAPQAILQTEVSARNGEIWPCPFATFEPEVASIRRYFSA